MKKYYQTSKLQEQIDWDNIMPMNRSAGGHDNQMKGLFRNSTLVGHYNEGNCQGQVATCVQLENGEYAIYNDYYGSCNGCDVVFDCVDDDDVRRLCINLSNSAFIFKSLTDVIEFLNSDKESYKYDWDEDLSKGLLDSIDEIEHKLELLELEK